MNLRFAANLNWLFTEYPMQQRFAKARQLGFSAVELLTPYDEPYSILKTILQQTDLQVVLINSPMGKNNQRGFASLKMYEQIYQSSIEQAIEYACHLGCQQIHVLAGNRDENIPYQEQYQQLIKSLQFAADLFSQHHLKLLIEPLNPQDMPGYFIPNLTLAKQVIEAVARDNIYLQFDIYHCQRTQGDILTNFKKYQNIISHIQVASSPFRHEPDQGEINYPWLFSELEKLGYQGWIGCEYQPQFSTEQGLIWFIERKK